MTDAQTQRRAVFESMKGKRGDPAAREAAHAQMKAIGDGTKARPAQVLTPDELAKLEGSPQGHASSRPHLARRAAKAGSWRVQHEAAPAAGDKPLRAGCKLHVFKFSTLYRTDCRSSLAMRKVGTDAIGGVAARRSSWR